MNVILSFVCMTSMPYAIFIIAGIPGGRHFALLSNSYDPAIRDFRIISHFAMYSGLRAGAFGARPCDPSESGADDVGRGGGPPPRASVGGAPLLAPPPAAPPRPA